MSGSSIVDWSVLQKLSRELHDPDWEVVGEMIDAFLKSAPPKIDELQRCLDGGRMDAAAEAAHFLKSGSSLLGFARFSASCKRLEQDAGVRPPAEVAEQLPALLAEWQALRDELALRNAR